MSQDLEPLAAVGRQARQQSERLLDAANLLAASIDDHAGDLVRLRELERAAGDLLAVFDRASPSGLITRDLIRQADELRLIVGRP